MDLFHYTNTLFLGGRSSTKDFVWVEFEPVQKFLIGLIGIILILLSVLDKPIEWDEILVIILGGCMVLYVIFRNRFMSPNLLRFNNNGVRGKLSADDRVRLTWDQINSIEYLPVKIVLHTTEGDTEIPIGHVDQKHRHRVMTRLEEVAAENNVPVNG